MHRGPVPRGATADRRRKAQILCRSRVLGPLRQGVRSFKRHGRSRAGKIGRPWEARRASWAVPTPETLSNARNEAGRPGNRACRNVSAFLALSDCTSPYPLGFSGKPFAAVGLGGELAIGALRLRHIPNKQKRAGVAGSSWGMPGGRIAKRSGAAEGREPAGAKPPRGGAFLLFDRA